MSLSGSSSDNNSNNNSNDTNKNDTDKNLEQSNTATATTGAAGAAGAGGTAEAGTTGTGSTTGGADTAGTGSTAGTEAGTTGTGSTTGGADTAGTGSTAGTEAGTEGTAEAGTEGTAEAGTEGTAEAGTEGTTEGATTGSGAINNTINSDKTTKGALEQLKEKVKYFTFIGDADSSNEELNKIIKAPTIAYKDIEKYTFGKGEIASIYYDKDQVLTLELPIEQKDNHNKYIYAVAIMDVDNVLIGMFATPKIAKLKGIGGYITYKIGAKGEAGKLSFEKTEVKRATQEEAEAGVDNFMLITPLRVKQYVDKRIATDAEAKNSENNASLITPKSLNSVVSREISSIVKDLSKSITAVDGKLDAKSEDFSKSITEIDEKSTKSITDISEKLKSVVPQKAIIMWGGAVDEVPAGWAICDGKNGTPDLRDRFIIGAGDIYKAGTVGGALEHTNDGKAQPTNMTQYYAICFIMKIADNDAENSLEHIQIV